MVFGLFKKKPDRMKIAEMVSNVLLVQLTVGGVDAGRLISDPFALGYLFGFHDGFLQALEVDNQTEGFVIMARSYHRLLGDHSTGEQVLRKSLDLQRDPAFMKGMFAGGQEAVEYLRDKQPPWGLAEYFTGGES